MFSILQGMTNQQIGTLSSGVERATAGSHGHQFKSGRVLNFFSLFFLLPLLVVILCVASLSVLFVPPWDPIASELLSLNYTTQLLWLLLAQGITQHWTC